MSQPVKYDIDQLIDQVARKMAEAELKMALSPPILGNWYKRYQGKEGEKCEIIPYSEFYESPDYDSEECIPQ